MKTLLIFALTLSALAADKAQPQMTKAEHKAEAARLASRASELAEKARKHEANAERLSKPGYNAMQHKWPALANGPLELERQRAMQARRAESETREKLAFHAAQASGDTPAEP